MVVADHRLGEGDQTKRRAAAHEVALFGLSQRGRGHHGVAGENVAGPRHRPQNVEVLDFVEVFCRAGGIALAAADGREVAAPAQALLVWHEPGQEKVTLPDKELHETDVTLNNAILN